MIDIHGHYLPGLDDGATDLAVAVAMCRRAAAEGCEAVIATPHLRRDEWPGVNAEAIARGVAELQRALGAAPIVHAGAEVRVDSELLVDLDRAGAVVPLAGSRYLLLELDPWGYGPEPVELVQELVFAGWRPIVAHPEVTPFLAASGDLLDRLVAAGAMLQVTASCLLGAAGRKPRELVRDLIESGLAHFVASDTHRTDWRPPALAEARLEVERGWGADVARRLFDENPRAVVENRPLPAEEAA